MSGFLASYILNTENQSTSTPVFLDKEGSFLIDLEAFLKDYETYKKILLVDENTLRHCVPYFDLNTSVFNEAEIIEIIPGEESKSIETCQQIWETISDFECDRNTLLVNIGGGMITDIGGFVASTYMRGISYINIPTTLMAQVDASVANKTGVNVNHIKNQIGSFYAPKAIFINPEFLVTLPKAELLSGYAEMLKHGLIQDAAYWKKLTETTLGTSSDIAAGFIEQSINIKLNIVNQDPFENGIRKILNFGHSLGHALETAALYHQKPLLHGEAVALGMVGEAYLSNMVGKLSSPELIEIQTAIKRIYAHVNPVLDDFQEIIDIIKHDKKNQHGKFRFSLLERIGHANYDIEVSQEAIIESLDYLKTIFNDQ